MSLLQMTLPQVRAVPVPVPVPVPVSDAHLAHIHRRSNPRQGQQVRFLQAAFQIERTRRRGPRLLQRALEHLPALRQQHHLLAQPLGVLHDMGGEQHRRTALRQFADNLFQTLLIDRIKSRKRLIEDHQFRLMHQAGNKLNLLRHALG